MVVKKYNYLIVSFALIFLIVLGLIIRSTLSTLDNTRAISVTVPSAFGKEKRRNKYFIL